MKIMHIISSLEMGGAQAVLYDLVSQLQKKGYAQTIVFFHDGPYRERFISLGITLHCVRGVFAPIDPVAIVRLMRFMKEYRPSIIHTVLWAANWAGRWAAQFLSIPCIVSLHNNYDQNGIIRNTIDRLIAYDPHHVVAVSDEVKQSFRPAIQKSSVSVIQNGIDVCEIITRADAHAVNRVELQLGDTDFVIGSVGRFAQVKQYPILLKAFAIIRTYHSHAKLVIVGQGQQEDAIRAYANSLGIASDIRWVVGKQAYGYYRLFDCFAMASSKEGISIALLEAMSLGIIPVVTYHIAQHPVIANGKNGYVAKCNNATDLAIKLGSLIRGGSRILPLQENAQQTVRNHFAISSMIASYSSLFQEYSNENLKRFK